MDQVSELSSAMESLSIQNSLPEDLIFKEILPRLPTKSLIRFKCVSRDWSDLISGDTSFAADHADRRSSAADEAPGSIIRARYKTEEKIILRMFVLGHGETKLVEIDTSYVWKRPDEEEGTTCIVLPIGSCNGLVCLRLFYSDGTTALVLWNPATREVNRLPTAVGISGGDERLHEYYFGFDKEGKDYKLLMFEETTSESKGTVVNVQMFTKSSGCWRHLNRFQGIEIMCGRGQGTTVDGTIHWAVETPFDSCPFHVLSFDLDGEEFNNLDGPLCRHDDRDFDDLHLVKWKGSLGAVLVKPGRSECQFWLKIFDDHDDRDDDDDDDDDDDRKVNFRWEKISTFDRSMGPVKSSGVFRDQLILTSDNDSIKKEFLYDVVTHEKRELEGDLGKVHYYEIFDHLHSLVSPN